MLNFASKFFTLLGFKACNQLKNTDPPWPDITLVHPNVPKLLDYPKL